MLKRLFFIAVASCLFLSCGDKTSTSQNDADNRQTIDETVDTDVVANQPDQALDTESEPDTNEEEDEDIVSCGQRYSVIVYGDTRDSRQTPSQHPQVVSAIITEIDAHKKKPEAVFNTGDLVYDGNDEAGWNDFFNEIDPILKRGIPYYPVLGNHEQESKQFFDRFDLPGNEQFYRVDIANFTFLVLDSNIAITTGSEQYTWLTNELSKPNMRSRFIAVLLHHPLYSTGPHGGDTTLRAQLHPLFLKKNVTMIFSGHDHAYERLEADGLTYFVTGGGGAPLYSAQNSADEAFSKKFKKTYHYLLITFDNCTATVSAKDISGEKFDTKSFVLTRSKTIKTE